MIAAPVSNALPASREDLLRHVEDRTNRQIRELDIAWSGSRVTVKGRSRSFYVKQLATQAIRAACPTVELDNLILVGTAAAS